VKFFITLLGLLLIVEGLPYVASPQSMQKWLRQIGALPPELLRKIGFIAMGLGLILCYLTQRTTFFG
jgi:uncharacterized protein